METTSPRFTRPDSRRSRRRPPPSFCPSARAEGELRDRHSLTPCSRPNATPCSPWGKCSATSSRPPARGADLDRVLARIAGALRVGGLLLFDLATPRRAPAVAKQTWTEGEGWAVMAEVSRAGDELRRPIVTFRDRSGGRFPRGEELHRLRLHRPAEVLGALRAAGFAAPLFPAATPEYPCRVVWSHTLRASAEIAPH